jgi:3'-5' exoribonuclease
MLISMTPPKPTVSRLGELTAGQKADFFALLASKVRRLTRDDKPYYVCRFRDARRTAVFMAWGDEGSKWFSACENDWQPGHFYKLRALYSEHERYGPQLDVLNIRPVNNADRADGFDEADFVVRSRQDPGAMLDELRDLATRHIADPALRKLVLTLLERYAAALQRLPATRDRAYPFVGGLLEHTLAVTRCAIDLAERYASYYTELQPPLNRELVAAAAVLHELGRVRELGDETPAPAPTVAGRLVGHALLGRDLVRDAARELGDVSPELLGLLEHVLLTCAGPEDGAGPPLVPEGLIVRAADRLDLDLELYVRCLTRDPGPGPFTERDATLGRRLLKARV